VQSKQLSTPSTCTPTAVQCFQLIVQCPNVELSEKALVSVNPAAAPAVGLVAFFSGGVGNAWWNNTSSAAAMLSSLNSLGYETVQVNWQNDVTGPGVPKVAGWLVASSGEQTGPANLGCRPASAVQWIYDNLYSVLGAPTPPVGECGFCITGNSGGAGQVSYALSTYDLGSILNGVFPTSGPEHASIDAGCLKTLGPPSKYAYNTGNAEYIDKSYGYSPGTGPCYNHDPSYQAAWQYGSVNYDWTYYFPTTRVHFIFGADDTGVGPTLGQTYYNALVAGGSPMVSEETVTGMGHPIQDSSTGLAALQAAITQSSPSPAFPSTLGDWRPPNR
jgi:hypothetical protein